MGRDSLDLVLDMLPPPVGGARGGKAPPTGARGGSFRLSGDLVDKMSIPM